MKNLLLLMVFASLISCSTNSLKKDRVPQNTANNLSCFELLRGFHSTQKFSVDSILHRLGKQEARSLNRNIQKTANRLSRRLEKINTKPYIKSIDHYTNYIKGTKNKLYKMYAKIIFENIFNESSYLRWASNIHEASLKSLFDTGTEKQISKFKETGVIDSDILKKVIVTRAKGNGYTGKWTSVATEVGDLDDFKALLHEENLLLDSHFQNPGYKSLAELDDANHGPLVHSMQQDYLGFLARSYGVDTSKINKFMGTFGNGEEATWKFWIHFLDPFPRDRARPARLNDPRIFNDYLSPFFDLYSEYRIIEFI
jgi:hypothetical protein